jgi:hypothetical protein
MPAAVSQQRVGEYVLELMPETDFATEPAGWASPVNAVVSSIDLGSAVPQELEDPAQRYDGGGYQSGVGLVFPNANVPISMKSEGIGALPADAAPAVHTFQTRLFATAMGDPGIPLKRSLLAAGGTATSVVEVTDNAHDPGAGGGYTFVAPVIGGKVYPRPGIYTPATETCALAIALPSAPAEGADNHAGILYQYKHNPSAPPTVSIRAVGNDTQQNQGLQGLVASFEMPETAPEAVPIENYACRLAAVSYDQAWTRGAATNLRARVLAGAEVILAKVGATAGFKYPISRLGLAIRPGFEPIGDTNGSPGIAGWGPAAGLAGYIDLTLPHNSDPDSVLGGSAYTSWEDFWRDNLDDQFQVLIVLGRGVQGHGVAHYIHRANVKLPTKTNVNGFDCRKLRFEPAARTAADIAAKTTHEFVSYRF